MGERKSATVLLTVIGIATLLVTLVGATFAFFTAQVEGNDTTNDVVIEAAELGSIIFGADGDVVKLENIYPGSSDEITFSVKPDSAASASVAYEVWMIVESNTYTSDNLKATFNTVPTTGDSSLIATDDALSLTTGTVLDATNYAATKEVQIASGVINPGEADNWALTVGLIEAGVDQLADQGQTFTARLEVRASTQYTQESVYRNN